jgi:hypothetical protein
VKRLIGLVTLVALIALLATATATAAFAKSGGGNSAAAHACQKGGYLGLVGANGETFRNVGACVSFAAHGGKFATGIIVPKGHTATFDDPTWSACNALAWGYTTGGPNIQLGTKAYGCTTTPVVDPDVTVGPFPTAVVLRVYLQDDTCSSTVYYSDGDHAHVTPTGAHRYQVDIADAGGFCERQTIPAVFTGPGNFSVGVVIN